MQVKRTFDSSLDRYNFDWGICSTKMGFAQVDTDQDFSHHGVWANPHSLTVISFCEGDVTVERANSVAEFVAKLRQINEFYDKCCIDGMCDKDLIAKFTEQGLGDLLH